MRSEKPLAPRNGHTLVAAIVARISIVARIRGCQNQEMSLEDQEDHGREVNMSTNPRASRIALAPLAGGVLIGGAASQAQPQQTDAPAGYRYTTAIPSGIASSAKVETRFGR